MSSIELGSSARSADPGPNDPLAPGSVSQVQVRKKISSLLSVTENVLVHVRRGLLRALGGGVRSASPQTPEICNTIISLCLPPMHLAPDTSRIQRNTL